MVGVAVVMFADRCTDYVDVEFSFEKEETNQLSCFLMLIFGHFRSLFSAGQAPSFRGWSLHRRAEKRVGDEASQPDIWCRCLIHCRVY